MATSRGQPRGRRYSYRDRRFSGISSWVASRSAASVGPNATPVEGDVVEFASKLKSESDGEIDVAGAELAHVLSVAGLVDEYRLYLRPLVFGAGKPYFAGPPPPLRLTKHEAIGDDVVRLCYSPA